MLIVGGVVLLSRPAGVAPKQVIDDLISSRLGIVVNLQRLLQLVQLKNILQVLTYPSVTAEDVVIDESSHRQLLK